MSLGLTVASLAVAVSADEPAKNYAETIPGSAVRFDLIAIPGGRFLMGSSLLEDGRGDDEVPRHRVVIRPFWMDKTEVTWDEYNEFRKGVVVSTGRTPRPSPRTSTRSPALRQRTRTYTADGL